MVSNTSLFVTFAVSITFLTVVYSQNTGNSSQSTVPSGSSTTPKAQSSPPPTTATSQSPTVSTKVPPTSSPQDECPKHNASCEDCIKAANYKCFYCYTGKKCMVYPVGSILPIKDCDLAQARWGVCWVNFEVLIITMSVIGFLIILVITCCCVRCFCCRGNNDRKYLKEEAKWERQKTERKQRSEERKADRKQRMDEIRRKYGLVKEDTPYQRFDA